MATTTAHTPARSSGRLILAAILAIFVYGMIAATLGTVMPTFNLTAEQKGSIALAQAIGLIIASLSAGPFVDNKGKKAALVTGLGLITLALFALPNSDGYTMYLLFFLLLGIGGGIVVTAANTLVSDISEERRASTLNFLNLFFGLGFMSTPFVAAKVLTEPASLLYAAAALAGITFLVHMTTPMPPPTGERGFKMSEAGAVIGRPALWLLALLLFFYVATEVGLSNWLPQYLVTQGIDQPTALLILSLGFGLGLLVGRVVVSRILVRVSAPTVTLASAVLMALTTYLLLQAGTVTLAWVSVFCAGLAMAPVFPTTLAMTGDAFPRMTATAMGIVITFGWIGLAVSSPIIGSVAGADASNLRTALLILPAFSFVMILLNVALRSTLRKR